MISKILQILGLQLRITIFFLYQQNIFLSQQVRTILVTKYQSDCCWQACFLLLFSLRPEHTTSTSLKRRLLGCKLTVASQPKTFFGHQDCQAVDRQLYFYSTSSSSKIAYNGLKSVLFQNFNYYVSAFPRIFQQFWYHKYELLLFFFRKRMLPLKRFQPIIQQQAVGFRRTD